MSIDKLGLDLDGNPGSNLFSPISFGTQNVLQPIAPATLNVGASALALSISDNTKFVASDYELNFSVGGGGTAGTITRRSDGVITPFDFATTNPVIIDGLSIAEGAGPASPGDRFLLKPFSTSASNITSQFSTPRSLAVASPVVGLMGTTNTGSLQQVSVVARGPNPPNPPPYSPKLMPQPPHRPPLHPPTPCLQSLMRLKSRKAARWQAALT